MTAPNPFKYKCPKCNYSKIVVPKSDVVNPIEMLSICPKCGADMQRMELTTIDKIYTTLFKK